MPENRIVNAAILRRIANSGLELTVRYPAARPVVSGVAPGAPPTNPLTGPAPTLVVFPTPPTPEFPDITIPCLWLDLATSAVSTLRRDSIRLESVGHMSEAEAVARVRVCDAAKDTMDPYGDTIFTPSALVLFRDHEYRVLSVKPMGPSFADPVTYYVWLVGAIKQ